MKYACVTIAVLLYSGPGFAADEALQEIVVTAQRRTERLQEVPAAITALSGESLVGQHLQGNADLASRVPSLSFDVQGPGESVLAIRGLGTSYGLAPSVSYYINETPLDIRTDGAAGVPDIDFFDVDRVEILRGPQGTLYGSSSMGGALRILTAQPKTTRVTVDAEAGASTMRDGGAGYLAKSALNLPIDSNKAVRIVGAFEHVGGYIDRVLPGDYASPAPSAVPVERRINDADVKSGRIIGLWQVNDSLSIKPSVSFSQIDAGSNSEYFTNLPRYSTAKTFDSPSKSRLLIGNLLVEKDFGFAALLSSSSVLSRDIDGHDDYSLLLANLAPIFGVPEDVNYPTTTLLTSHNSGFIQELRLTSPSEHRLRWVAGLYFSHFKQHSTEIIDSAAFAGAIGQTDGINIYSFDQSLIDQQGAVFADLTYRVSTQLEITAGARYYRLKESLENTQGGVLAAPNQPLVHAKSSGTSPRLVLTYRPIKDATLYATAARGYRPGGPNVGLPDGIGCSLTNAYSPLYDPDSVWNYELGVKTEFMQRRLSINLAAYRIDWKDVQQAVTDPGCGYIIVANVGAAQSNGIEAEVNFKPFESLLLTAGGSYTRAKFTSIATAFQGASDAQSGDPIPDVPRQKFNLGAEYSTALRGDRNGFVRLDWSHLGAVPTGFTQSFSRPAYSRLDASIGLKTERYEVSVFGRNLNNADGILEIREGATATFGDVFGTRISAPPRTVGIDFKVHY